MLTHRTATSALVLVILACTAATPAAAKGYQIDPVHSSVVFKIKHLYTSHFYGTFNELSGNLVLDRADPKNSSITLEIRAESVDSRDPRRDRHLRSPDFLSAVEFPVIAFRSTAVLAIGESRYQVTGQLTLRGVTRTIVALVEHTGTGHQFENPATEIVGFEARLVLKRSDYGVNYLLGPLGDEVELVIAIEAFAT